MCGFVGFTGNIDDKLTVIDNMMQRIVHRGPDDKGVFSNDDVTLGFCRLSIIGLESGKQPLFNEDETVGVVFNGEIYNYQSLKEQLLKKGHVFKTDSDTEVLVHLYEEHGFEMINMLRGMFSFVIYDKKNKQIFAVRDYFGIKPLYYTVVGQDIIFGSEIKAILKHPKCKKEVNTVALENYLSFQYSVLEETFFKDIFKLMPGTYLVFKDGQASINKYFEPEFEIEKAKLQDTIKSLEDVLIDSVNHHKVSDVEVGSFLSSGVDSSFVAATFKGQKTFTVGFSYDNYNEIDYAKDLSKALGITNFNKVISDEEYWEAIPKVQYYMDEPLADPSAVALYFVSKLAKEKVKVVLSGEGADEFFGGYNIYKEPFSLSPLTWMPKFFRRFLAKLVSLAPFNFKGKNFIIRASKDVEERFIGNAKIFSKKEREDILKNHSFFKDPIEVVKPFYDKVKTLDPVTKMQFIDINFWLVGDILLKADKMSMANSLELRVPFLDKCVFDVSKKIQDDYRVNKQATKYIFRMIAKKYLPDNVANKKKLGFPTPIRVWILQEKYFEQIKAAFLSKTAAKYFNTDKILKYLENHKQQKGDFSRKIWTIYMFLVWHDQFFSEV